jgi:conjugative relaxase-like TrwC/TraI family protein
MVFGLKPMRVASSFVLRRTFGYATAVYRSELAHRLKDLGYEIERGESSQPEIKGYSKEYLKASSPRRQQIEEHLAKENQRGAGAAQIAAHQKTRRKTRTLTRIDARPAQGNSRAVRQSA